ncbi:MAG TPA: polysaccharide biosynthesis protein [Desulfotomaculum sp.]|nr:MAG: hypothetical protein JL56_15680 [Desulfotomaculum sp. BICA1-6]HBX22982.1 polysaccharide biosynthesis protein [Desulfotomaculum sp.]
MRLIVNFLKSKNVIAGSFYLIGNLFNKAIAFLTVPIFTRLMSTSDYGIVNTYMSWVSILSLVVGLSLGNSIRSAYMDFKEDLDGYISSIFFLALLNFVVSSTVIILIAYYFLEQVDIILVVLCLVQSFMTFVINTITIKYMLAMEYIKKTLLLALPNIVIVILSVVFLLNMDSYKYLGRIVPYVAVLSILGTFYLVKFFVVGKNFIKKTYWSYAIGLSIPLILHGLSVNILRTSDRTMITVFQSASETGIYSLVYNLSMVALVVTTSLESVWIPWFNKKMQNNDKTIINKHVKMYIEIVLVAFLSLLMISPEVLIVMAPREYWVGIVLIAPILLGCFFMFLYSISVNLEFYYKSTKIIAINTIIAASLNLALNFAFIPLYGAMAAAITTVVAYVVSFGIHYCAARKLDNQLFPFKIYTKPILIMCIGVFISYLLIDYAIIRWSIALIGLLIYLFISLKRDGFVALLK